MGELEIDVGRCRVRQRRLLDRMEQMRLDAVVVYAVEHVQWLTGLRWSWMLQSAAVLVSDGRCIVAAPNKGPELSAADHVVTYEAQWRSTLRNDQRQACTAALADVLRGESSVRRVGVEYSHFGRHPLLNDQAELVDIEPELFQLRRRKEADELARIQSAIDGTEAMYARAREIIRPGINELEVFNQLQAAAVDEFGEMLTGTGNDYRCGQRGGPPRDYCAQDGELYILDLGPAFRGYFADNCRTISVNSHPTDLQQAAWEKIVSFFPLVEQTVKPGQSCRQLFEAAQAHLDEFQGGVFNHHLGHGIGLFPHEAPHLNPNWDDTFEVGDVFAVEPGLYAPELRSGIRIENNYVVTETGVELLSDFSMEL